MIPIGFIGAGVLLLAVIFQFMFFTATLKSLEQDAPEMTCQRLTHSDLYGPEDMTMSTSHNVMFISSHNRREFSTEGAILMLNTDTNEIIKLPAEYPVKFHPHGISLFEDEVSDTSRLFVISHLMETLHDDGNHSIEVFDFDHESKSLRHVETLVHESVVHPNDLLALSKHELLISNDHGDGTKLRGLLDDVLHIPRSDLVYYNGLNSATHRWNVVNAPPIEFGNGLIATPLPGAVGLAYMPSAEEFSLYRASCTEFALHRYDAHRKLLGGGDVVLLLQETELIPLPIAPDNLEYDPLTGGILVAGHPSTYAFMIHAILRQPSPSSVMLYDPILNLTADANTDADSLSLSGTKSEEQRGAASLYYNNGVEISGSSVAVRDPESKGLYIGQVFDPFILHCKPSE